MKENDPKGKLSGVTLLPFVLFIAIYLGAGLYMQSQGVEMAFYQFPAAVAIFLAAVFAFCLKKGSLSEKFTIFAKGAGHEDILTMLMIYLLAGAFSSVAKGMGGVEATVNLGLSFVPAQFLVAGVFIISAFLGVATGSSCGTIGALTPIALGVAAKASLPLPLVLASCVGGSMFGDNLSVISDTTIAATRTQGCEMRDKFRLNFLIALPAALLTIVLLLVVGKPETIVPLGSLEFNVIKVIPYLLVLILALVGVNVFMVLTIGIFSAGIIGIACSELTIFSFSQAVWSGFTGMNEVFLLSLFCGGIAQLTTHYGGIDWLVSKISKFAKGKRSAQVGVAALVSAADVATANNTVAIIITGKIAKEISREYKVDPRKTASLLDIFSCIFQGLIPYGAQLLIACGLTAGLVSPMDVIPKLYYTHLLAIVAIVSIFIPFADGMIKKDPWNWEHDIAESKVADKIATEKAANATM